MISLVSFNRFTLIKFRELVLCNMNLKILSISFWAGFSWRTLGLFRKCGLWYFKVIKQLFLPFTNNRLTTSLYSTIFFPSALTLLLILSVISCRLTWLHRYLICCIYLSQCCIHLMSYQYPESGLDFLLYPCLLTLLKGSSSSFIAFSVSFCTIPDFLKQLVNVWYEIASMFFSTYTSLKEWKILALDRQDKFTND